MGPNRITKKEYRTNRMLYPLWKDGTSAADLYWGEEMDEEFYMANGQTFKKQNNMNTAKLKGFTPGAPTSQPYAMADGGTNYQPSQEQINLTKDLVTQAMQWIKGRNNKNNPTPTPPTYTPTPEPIPTPSTGWSTGEIIGVSLAGLTVGASLFFGIRYLVRRKKNQRPATV